MIDSEGFPGGEGDSPENQNTAEQTGQDKNVQSLVSILLSEGNLGSNQTSPNLTNPSVSSEVLPCLLGVEIPNSPENTRKAIVPIPVKEPPIVSIERTQVVQTPQLF